MPENAATITTDTGEDEDTDTADWYSEREEVVKNVAATSAIDDIAANPNGLDRHPQ